jgi:pimeloyl-[acyl-carrier protein] methyl ester esterase
MNAPLFCERQDVTGGTAQLVCIHGWGMNLRAFDPLREALRSEHGSWALDLPGHGRSAWHDARADLESQLQDIHSALPTRCVLVGWSLGGQLALELARRAPLQVRALVLIACTPRFTQAADWPHGLDAQTMQAFSARLEQDWRQTLRDFVQLQVRGGRNAEITQRQLEAALEAHGLPRALALRAGLAILAELDQRALAAQVLQPTLVISGQNDRVTPPTAGAWLADALPNARRLQIARAGHAPLLSHVDEVQLAISGFLDSLPRDRQGVAA